MKEAYEKPKMVTETIEIGKLIAGSQVEISPIPADVPFGGMCCP